MIDWTAAWLGGLFTDPNALVFTMAGGLVTGIVLGAIAVALTVAYRR
jgi:hypothetical protein